LQASVLAFQRAVGSGDVSWRLALNCSVDKIGRNVSSAVQGIREALNFYYGCTDYILVYPNDH
jgi:hypothetical protein